MSDSALSQAVRTMRRTLGDDPREPRFIRTVPRHGYRFVFPDLVEDDDDNRPTSPTDVQLSRRNPSRRARPSRAADRSHHARPATAADEEDQREAAEILHGLGASEALRRTGGSAGTRVRSRAPSRNAMDAPTGGDVPLAGAPAPIEQIRAVVLLRLRRAARLAALRWAGAAFGAGLAGAIGGAIGGLILVLRTRQPGAARRLAGARRHWRRMRRPRGRGCRCGIRRWRKPWRVAGGRSRSSSRARSAAAASAARSSRSADDPARSSASTSPWRRLRRTRDRRRRGDRLRPRHFAAPADWRPRSDATGSTAS